MKGKRIEAALELDTFLDRRSRNLQGWSCRLPLFGGHHGALPPEDNKNEGASGDIYEKKDARQKAMRNAGLLRRFYMVLATIEANFGSFVFLA